MDAKYDTFFAARDGNKKIEVVSERQGRSKWLIIRATTALAMAASNLQETFELALTPTQLNSNLNPCLTLTFQTEKALAGEGPDMRTRMSSARIRGMAPCARAGTRENKYKRAKKIFV